MQSSEKTFLNGWEGNLPIAIKSKTSAGPYGKELTEWNTLGLYLSVPHFLFHFSLTNLLSPFPFSLLSFITLAKSWESYNALK